ncbi:hypothetical protein FG386_001876 [Cryptosporidium ryanae]|uniref:uncharacterized protein n=1 Tax=Cryptosporidium ryanae TaxID=515981 RepID=UPI00351A231F|nr:hypothetical protein FG386_001876 [Cryptosporidium ryanae]
MNTENGITSFDTEKEGFFEEELVFIDLPELSRFEIFDGMDTIIENLILDESDGTIEFELNIESKESIHEDESIRLKFQGNSVKTMGTCMFFNINEKNEDQAPSEQSSSYNYDKNMYLDNNINLNKTNRKTGLKVDYVGKCNSVIQAFAKD